MSITIRLARTGRKNLPSYKLVVSTTRDKRNGRYVDIVGYYNPSLKPAKFEYNQEKYNSWIGKGALVTDAVKKLIAGEYKYTPYKGSKEEAATAPQAEQSTPETA